MQTLEKILIYCFLVTSVVISFLFVDLFPFSLNPLFTKRTDKYSFITIRDQSGNILSNKEFETYLDYGSNNEKAGLKSPATINEMGNFVSSDELKAHVLNKLINYPFIQKVTIHITNVSAYKSGVVYDKYNFELTNPKHNRSAEIKNDIYQKDKYRRSIKNGELLAP